jgi:hypothetical protein
MIGKTIDGTFPDRAPSTATGLLRRLLRGVLVFAMAADVTATWSASFAQSGSAGVQPDSTSSLRPGGRHVVSEGDSSYLAVGQLIGPMPCTGTAVLHPRIVLTAADCVIERGRVVRTLSFRPAYVGSTDFGAFEGRVVAVGSVRQLQRQSIHDASQDWAIILLNKRPPRVRPFDVAGYTPFELQSMRGRILLPSYSHDLARGQALSVDPSCSIEGVKWEVLVHDCAASVGALGAPLLVRDEDCYSVVGVHSGSMLVEDRDAHDGHMQFAGRSAIGTWNFVYRLRTTLSQLDADEGMEDVPTRSQNGCAPVMVLSHSGGLLSTSL